MSLGYVVTLDPCCAFSPNNPPSTQDNSNAIVDVFAGPGSPWHVAVGFLASLLGSPLDVAVFAFFAGYQVSQAATGESWQSTGGEFVEFGIGVVLGRLLMGARA